MTDRRKVLVVEDEEALAGVIGDYLRRESMEPILVHDGARAMGAFLRDKPDLIILDLSLPGVDGLTICREVRSVSDVPIIIVSAKVDEIDRLIGLELGADDYICKPFSVRELITRVKVVLRRLDRRDAAKLAEPAVTRLVLDEEKWLAFVDGASLNLTRREFRLLATMQRKPGRVFSREQLLASAFPDDADVFERVVDSHIKNIRLKIREIAPDFDPIRSVYGVGYAFDL